MQFKSSEYEFLLENFKKLANSSASIEHLKLLVLQMAVQGKLTNKWREQNPNLESSIVLFEKIIADKERLIRKGEIKRQKPLSNISVEEKPFKLPGNWLWIRLKDYGVTNTGTTPSKNNPEYFGNDYPFIKPAEISYDGINYDTEDGLTKLGLAHGRLISKNSVLMVCIGGSIGKCYYTIKDISCNQQINTITPLASVSPVFLNLFLQSKYFQDAVWDRASGGTTPIINKGKWERIPIPLPPFAEQEVIVLWVEKLITQINKLNTSIHKRLNYREKSAKAIFGKMNKAKSDNELQGIWQMLPDHFHTLIQSKEGLKQLRQSILQLAIKGRLTTKWRDENPDCESRALSIINDFNDLNKINTGRRKFLRKVNNVIFEDDSIPQNWIKTQFFNLCVLRRGHDLPKSERMDGNYAVASSGGITGRHNEFIVEEGVVIGRSGSTGKPHYISEKHWPLNTVLYGDDYCGNDKRFVFVFFKSFAFDRYTTQTAVPTLNRNKFLNELVLIPPLEEQKVIVTKVKKLLAWCDELENLINKRDAYQEKMMQAIAMQSLI